MKKKSFTLIELIAVITIMAILLTMLITISKPDRAKADTRIIGGLIKLYHAKVTDTHESKSYTIHIGQSFTITDQDGILLESKEIKSPIVFLDGPTSKTFTFNHRGEVTDLSKKLRFKVGAYKVKLNVFTGKFSYYDKLAEY